MHGGCTGGDKSEISSEKYRTARRRGRPLRRIAHVNTIPFRFFVVSVVAHGGLLLAPSGERLSAPPLISTAPFAVQLSSVSDAAVASPAQPADRNLPTPSTSPAATATRALTAHRIAAVTAIAEPRQFGAGRESLVYTPNNNPDTDSGGRTGLDTATLQTDVPEHMLEIDEPRRINAPSLAESPIPAWQPSAPQASTTVAAAEPIPAKSNTIPPTDSFTETDGAQRTDTTSHAEPVSVATAAPEAEPSASAAASEAIASRARREIEALLALRFHYPPLARKHGWQGRVQVRVTVSASGRIDAAQIVKSSGYRVLDRNAVKTLRRIGRLPGDAQWLQGHELSLDVPIRYQLING